MTAFDELCRMLDERGARYFRQEREGKGTLARVSWEYPAGSDSPDVFVATVVRYGDHLRFRGYLTPEQAIAATLGHSSNCTNGERTSDEPLPCPFCGRIPIVDCGYHYDYDGGNRYYAYSADVECCCGCTLHVEHEGPKEYVTNEHMLDFAIAAWNRRAES